MTGEYALPLEKKIIEGRTAYKIYSSDAEFHADVIRLAAEKKKYHLHVLAEADLELFLKRHRTFLRVHSISSDPAEVAVVSYTRKEKSEEVEDPFAVENF